MSFRASVVLAILALAPVLAGCASPSAPGAPDLTTPPPIPPGWAANALAFGEGHDHTDPKQHAAMSTSNFELLGWDPLSTDRFKKTAGGYLCGESAETAAGRKLAVISSFTTDIAFVLADVTDPARPQKVGEYALKGVKTYDTAMTPDGKHVIVASDAITALAPNEEPTAALAGALPLRTMRVEFTDACTGETIVGPEEELPLQPGVVMVGIQDPKKPVFEDFHPTPIIGPHSVSTARIDNVSYVTASITNLAHAASYYNFYTILDTPLGSKLELLSTVDAQQYGKVMSDAEGATGNGHVDVSLAKHPVTKKLVAYLSNWDGGLVTLDMTNPRAPLLLGAWLDTDADGGAVHSAVPVDSVWDGKHYVIVGQEFIARPSNRPSGWIYIIDDTDPTKMKEVARWTLPVDTQADWGQNELFSTHYFGLVGRTLFVTMYHGGVWAVDLADPTTPRSVGVFLPTNEPPNPPKVDWKGQIRAWPYVLDIFPYSDGTLAAFDATSGVYVLRFDATTPAPMVSEWPASGQSHEG